MGSLLEVVSPLGRGRRYGFVSASFLFLVVLAEIEGLAFIAIALLVGRPDLFLAVQESLFPAAWVVSVATALAVLWRARNWSERRSQETEDLTEVADSFVSSNWKQRIGMV